MLSIGLYVLKSVLLPPGVMVLLLIIGLCFFLFKMKKTGYFFCVLGTLLLYFGSLPVTANFLAHLLEYRPALTLSQASNTKAKEIVILSSGTYLNAPEYEHDTVGQVTLARLHFGAALYQKTHLPILVSGGAVFKGGTPCAAFMAKTLKNSFDVPTKWQEKKSRNTWENAQFSAMILKKAGIKKILLVTDAIHIPRSLYVFKHFGIDAIPAPTNYMMPQYFPYAFMNYLPEFRSLFKIEYCLHELYGLIFYHLFGKIS